MENEFYVYVIYRKDNNNPFYVGKGRGIRFKPWYKRNRFYNAVYKKVGGYSKIIFNNLNEEEALRLEEETITELKEFYNLTNISSGGISGNLGIKMDEKHKSKVSEAVKRQWSNPETRERLIQSRRISHAKPEVRKKLSKARKGKVLSEEHKESIKKSLENKEIKKKMSESKSKYYNIHLYDKEGSLRGIFDTTRDLAEWFERETNTKVSLASIIRVLSGDRKSYKGYYTESKKRT